jgi:dihydroorotate dehydrogenase (fumarate)
MITLETSYLGLKLKNPIIISSSGLTNSAQKNLALEKAGAGAIVLKSLFEEQIMMNSTNLLHHGDYTEASDYIKNYVQAHSLTDYLELVTESKRLCSIPIIASINCYRSGDWATFAHQIEMAGANALELNIFILNTDKHANSNAVEEEYINIVKQTRKAVNIPISVKIGQQFTGLVALSEKLIGAGANSIVLFNRFYQPDIDLKTIEFKQGETFSSPADFSNTLRWTSLISGLVKDANVVSTTGIHDWENGVKALLAGAQAIEICSTLYKNGNGVISEIITCMESWMQQHGYLNINEFRGKLNYGNISNPALYERSQFMKYYSDDSRHKGEIYFS